MEDTHCSSSLTRTSGLRSWYHRERGTSFDGIGPPGTTVWLYYVDVAGQIVLLHATSGKAGKGKLQELTKRVVEQRLPQWREWFPHGADIDGDGRLVARPKRGGKT